ncbi:MAG: DUF2911 domain-containing protein [Bryobacterales bacterium]|nr:DUF2911 domain-containing protein [Bryobacterales bacterium]
MTKSALLVVTAAALTAAFTIAFAQGKKKPLSPPAETSVTIDGKTLAIKYSAPSMRGRKIFGDGGVVSHDSTYPVWRAGANAATSFHTDADLTIGGLAVPKGDYTLFVLVNTDPWQLIISKQTREWGLAYKQDMDLGRVKMTMAKPPSPIETYKMTLSGAGAKSGKLQLEWENVIASVPITVK